MRKFLKLCVFELVLIFGGGSMNFLMPDHQIWIWLTLFVLSVVAFVVLYIPEIRGWCRKCRGTIQPHASGSDWAEFDVIPLKYAACMWAGLSPSEASLQNPLAQEELARLSLAVKQGKLDHWMGEHYRTMDFLFAVDPATLQFSREALVRYAEHADRETPTFLRS